MRLLQIELGLVQYLVDGVTREGGWGNEPGEFKEANPLNTAEVLGGLLSVHHHLPRGPLRTHCDERIAGGMRYLLSTQLASGGWATGSAYIRKDIGSKGNIVSTVWAIWSLLEGARRCELGGQERGAIKTALECSQAYLRNRVGGLWAYSPELAEANPMASAYGLFGMALLLQAECDFGRWADQAALHLCVHEGLSRFEADYIAGGAVLTCEPAMNRMVVIQFFLALGQLLRCDGLATMEGKLRILSDRLWATVRSYGAEHLADRPPYRLSSGEKRTVAIATILSMQPQILVMDEPSSGLDPAARRRLIELLASFHHTRIIATHDLDLVLDLCTRTIVIHQGKVMADRPTLEIFDDADLLRRSHLEAPLRLQSCPICTKRLPPHRDPEAHHHDDLVEPHSHA